MWPAARLLPLLVATSAICAGTAAAQSGCSSPPRAIPMEMRGNLIFIPVRVNGSEPRSFLVDTGASTSVLNAPVANLLGLAPRRHKANIGAGELSTEIGSAKGVTLSLPGVDLPQGNVAIIPLGVVEARLGVSIDGIVGADLFRRYVVTIDYAGKSLSLCEPAGFDAAHAAGTALDLRLSGNRPFIHAEVTPLGGQPIDGEFAIDTGDTSSVTLHTPFVEKYGLLHSQQSFVPHVSTGLSGDSRSLRGRLQKISLGPFSMERPTTTFSEAKRGSEADGSYSGILGEEVLGRFRITLDYSRRKLLLEPNTHLNDSFDDDMSGAVLAASGAGLRTFTVVEVIENSPAAQAGLQRNDVLETIDGGDVAQLTLPQIKQMFRADGESRSLVVRRGDVRVTLKLTLRRML